MRLEKGGGGAAELPFDHWTGILPPGTQCAASVIAVRCIGQRSALHVASHRTAFLAPKSRTGRRGALE